MDQLQGVAVAAQVIPALLIVQVLPSKPPSRRLPTKEDAAFAAVDGLIFALAGFGEAIALLTLVDGNTSTWRLCVIYAATMVMLGLIVTGPVMESVIHFAFSVDPTTHARLFAAFVAVLGAWLIWGGPTQASTPVKIGASVLVALVVAVFTRPLSPHGRAHLLARRQRLWQELRTKVTPVDDDPPLGPQRRAVGVRHAPTVRRRRVAGSRRRA